jgi:acyl carrier protein
VPDDGTPLAFSRRGASAPDYVGNPEDGMALTRDDILTALRTELGVDTSGVDESTPLFSAGLIDSFSLVSLILFLETRGGISVQPMDVTLENFDSVGRMLAYVARVQNAASSTVP